MPLAKLAKYQVDKAFTEGVELFLDDALDCPFLVKLPGEYNRPYIVELYGAIEVDFDADGETRAKTNVMAAREGQINAFVKHCIVSVDGEPTPDGFATEYPKAVSELMTKANSALEALQEDVEEAAKKSQPTLVGNQAGVTA